MLGRTKKCHVPKTTIGGHTYPLVAVVNEDFFARTDVFYGNVVEHEPSVRGINPLVQRLFHPFGVLHHLAIPHELGVRLLPRVIDQLRDSSVGT